MCKGKPRYVCRSCCHPTSVSEAMNDVGDEEGAGPRVPLQTSLGQLQLGLQHEYITVSPVPLTPTSASWAP